MRVKLLVLSVLTWVIGFPLILYGISVGTQTMILSGIFMHSVGIFLSTLIPSSNTDETHSYHGK